ncbi:MAG TPA: hypothetical protein VFY84_00230, partial [Jiangellales bacterium]|nr:hypothetical protein [Jiangellales bacterium]
MATTFAGTLTQLLKARFPLLYIESYEEQRVVDAITAVAHDGDRIRTARSVWVWSLTRGLVQPDGTPRPGT